jgi:hypothetical protein
MVLLWALVAPVAALCDELADLEAFARWAAGRLDA